MNRARLPALVSLVLLAACSVSTTQTGTGTGKDPGTPTTPATTACTTDDQCAGSADTPLCEPSTKVCSALPPGHEIGYRDGTAASVAFTQIYAASASSKLIDLDFRPDHPDELWAVGYGDNSIYVGTGISTDTPKFKRILDPAAGHFMRKPPAIAMGTPEFFATCGDNLDERGGGESSATLFMGPSLFSTDLSILGKSTPDGLGSHMDMLHNSPLCRGIAHESANIFWVFNAYDKAIDKYNFNADHGPGNDDHSDGEIYRYAAGKVRGSDDGTPSHLVFDPEENFLYVADTGNKRIIRFDTTKGKKGGGFLDRQNEPLEDQGIMSGVTIEEIVPAGTLEKPSGIALHKGLLYVTDSATGIFHVFDKTGGEVRKLASDLPAGSLSGLAVGPDGKVYFTDKLAGKIFRIDPQ